MPSLIEKSFESGRIDSGVLMPEIDVIGARTDSRETRVPEIFQVTAITPGGIAVLRENTHAKTGNVDVGALDARTCFVKGTLVRTPSGFKEIQDIRPGDEVLAWNEKSGELTISRVQQTFVRTTDAIYKVTYEDGTVIETTWSHPFYVAGQGWVKGKDLRAGMRSPTATAIAMHNERVAMSGGYRLPVQTVAFHGGATANNVSGATVSLGADLPGAVGIASVEVVPGTETVYNFAVEEEHNYFIGEDGILVHNESYLVNPTAFNIHKRIANGISAEEMNEAFPTDIEKARFALGQKYGGYFYQANEDLIKELGSSPEAQQKLKAEILAAADKLGLQGKEREAFTKGMFDQAVIQSRIDEAAELGNTLNEITISNYLTFLPFLMPGKGAMQAVVAAEGSFFGRAGSFLGKTWSGFKGLIGLGAKIPVAQFENRAIQTIGRSHSSEILGKNLEVVGLVRPANSAAHHIVGQDSRAAQALAILKREGVDINEAFNGVFLPKNSRYALPPSATHTKLHTDVYYQEITKRLLNAQPGKAREALRQIADDLVAGTFPY